MAAAMVDLMVASKVDLMAECWVNEKAAWMVA